MNVEELEALLDAMPCPSEKEATVASRAPPPPPIAPRTPRFARFGIDAAPASGEEARSASERISAALAKRPLRVTSAEWGQALHRAQSFWHANVRPGAEKFLSLPIGPRVRYHVWGASDAPDVIDIVLLHDLGEAGGGLSDLGVQLSRRGYRTWAPDFRGHGDTSATRPYTADALIEDLRSFIVELDLYRRPLIVIGFGFGASIAFAFRARHPSLVGGSIFVDVDPTTVPEDFYRFHPSQAASFPDVHALVDRACSPELLELVDQVSAGARRDITRALPRLSWAIRENVSTLNGSKAALKMDPEWCFFPSPDERKRAKPTGPVRLVRGERNANAATKSEFEFASVAIPGAGSRCLEDRPRETRDAILDAVLSFEGAIYVIDVTQRTPEKLGASVRALQTFETVEQAVKVLSARPPPTSEAVEAALAEARAWDETDSEDDEESRRMRNRTTALAKDDPGYFGFIG
jgi:pimeloyl-ACP methyl ester carboxylesterase